MTSIPLIKSQPHPCSYLARHTAQASFVSPAFPMTALLYSQLIGYGFRRSGDDVYKPSCPACTLCIPSRLLAKDFKPNRSQKRCQKTNHNTEVIIKPPLYAHGAIPTLLSSALPINWRRLPWLTSWIMPCQPCTLFMILIWQTTAWALMRCYGKCNKHCNNSVNLFTWVSGWITAKKWPIKAIFSRFSC